MSEKQDGYTGNGSGDTKAICNWNSLYPVDILEDSHKQKINEANLNEFKISYMFIDILCLLLELMPRSL